MMHVEVSDKTFLAILLVLASCQSTINRRNMRAELARAPLTQAQDLGQVIELEPVANVPFVLAVAPPFSQRTGTGPWLGPIEGQPGFRPWTQAERREIDSWRAELEHLGLVKDMVVMTLLSTELDGAKNALAGLRVAGARHHADAVLVVSELERTSSWLNPWSILDLTLVGGWFAPGHNVEVVSVLEGALVDTHTGYLYGSGQAQGSARARRAWFYIDDPRLQERARRRALADLKRELLKQAEANAEQRAGASS